MCINQMQMYALIPYSKMKVWYLQYAFSLDHKSDMHAYTCILNFNLKISFVTYTV